MIQLHEEPQSVEIAEIQIWAEYQGLGLGTRVLKDIIESAVARKKLVTLYLGLKNIRARDLYLRLGFHETGRSDTHIFMAYQRNQTTARSP